MRVLQECWRSAHCAALALSHLNLAVDEIIYYCEEVNVITW
jgi:hypothetical protein